MALYVSGDFEKARAEAQKVGRKYAKKKSSEEVAATVADAERLASAVDAHLRRLSENLDTALQSGDARAILEAQRALLAGFPKTPEGKRAKALAKEITDEALLASLEAWTDWHDLQLARPALFPARVDKSTKRYAKKVEKYVKGATDDAPGVEEARKLLEAFEG